MSKSLHWTMVPKCCLLLSLAVRLRKFGNVTSHFIWFCTLYLFVAFSFLFFSSHTGQRIYLLSLCYRLQLNIKLSIGTLNLTWNHRSYRNTIYDPRIIAQDVSSILDREPNVTISIPFLFNKEGWGSFPPPDLKCKEESTLNLIGLQVDWFGAISY